MALVTLERVAIVELALLVRVVIRVNEGGFGIYIYGVTSSSEVTCDLDATSTSAVGESRRDQP